MKYTDTERLTILGEALEHMPAMSIVYADDDATEDDCGMIPRGWNIRVPSVCTDDLTLNAKTFPELLDALIRWKDQADADALT